MICKTVNDLVESINHCVYFRENVFVCNLCGNEIKSLNKMFIHLCEIHKDDTIPDVDPTK